MYCPKCSADAGADAARYCRSCGFRLDVVAILMTRNGELESFVPAITPPPATKTVSPRKKGLRSGGMMVFFSLFAFPFAYLYATWDKDVWPLFIPGTVFLMGVMRMLYAWLFEDSIPESAAAIPPAPTAAGRPVSALPGAYQPLPVRTEAPNTINVNQPSSVTEPTTNLLGKQ
jgi:hypothetical protein